MAAVLVCVVSVRGRGGGGWHAYIYEADIELLGCVPSLQVASGINIIVADDSGDDV